MQPVMIPRKHFFLTGGCSEGLDAFKFSHHVCMYGHTYSKSNMDPPGKVANPACGQLKRDT